MKVGISVSPLYNIKGENKNIDGIGRYTHELCSALSDQNVYIEKIYFKNNKEIFSKSKSPRENFSIAPPRLLSLLPGLSYHPNKTLDILHITDYLLPRVKNVPIVATIHDAILLEHKEWLETSSYRNYLRSVILPKLMRRVDAVIVISEAAAIDAINSWKISEHKMSVVHHGLSKIWQQRIDPSVRQAVMRKYQLAKPFFLTVGTLQARKNIDRIINVWNKLPKNMTDHFDLVIVGKENPCMTAATLLRRIQQQSADHRLHWLSYVPFADLLALYQSSHALLYPSLAEGFGFPILEGFASATPVITSNFGATAEIAGDAAYLLDPHSEEAISEAMIHLAEKPDIRDSLIKKGLARVQTFTWEKCAKATVDVYKKLI